MDINQQPTKCDASAINADLDRAETGLLQVQLCKKSPNTTGNTIKTLNTMDLPYSSIRVLQVANPPGPSVEVFLKRITIPGKERSIIEEALVRETHLLEKLNRHLPEESVELIASFPEYQTIATRACSGQPVDKLINSYPFWWQTGLRHNTQRQRLARLCGDWLKRYHALTVQHKQHIKPWYDYLCGEMDWRIQALKQGRTQDSSLYSQVAERFYSDLSEQEQYGTTSVYHGDFAPHNIFDNQKKISVIDFFGAQSGNKLMDLINFIATIASRAESPLYPRGRINTFCQQFIAAYDPSVKTQDTLAVPLLILQTVKRLLVLQNNEPRRVDHKLAHQRSMHWHHQYLASYLKNQYPLITKGPWPFLDLSGLSPQ